MMPYGFGFDGTKKNSPVMSPTPLWLPSPMNGMFWSITGTITRDISVQSASSLAGTTGWKLSWNLCPLRSAPNS